MLISSKTPNKTASSVMYPEENSVLCIYFVSALFSREVRRRSWAWARLGWCVSWPVVSWTELVFFASTNQLTTYSSTLMFIRNIYIYFYDMMERIWILSKYQISYLNWVRVSETLFSNFNMYVNE